MEVCVISRLRKVFVSLHEVGLRNTLRRIRDRIHPLATRLYDSSVRQMESDFLAFPESQSDSHPLISIVIPVYRPGLEHFEECVRSIQSQTFQNVEICICNDSPKEVYLNNYLEHLIEMDSRIRVCYNIDNLGISAAINNAGKMCLGEYIAVVDNDDTLSPRALEFVASVIINSSPEFIYTDEDKIDYKGRYCEPFFKPDWSPESLLSCNYVTHLAVIRRDVLDLVGWFNSLYDGSQDYELFLRIAEHEPSVVHIREVLYHWRMSHTSTASNPTAKGYAYKAAVKALEDSFARRGYPGTTVEMVKHLTGHYLPSLKTESFRVVSISSSGDFPPYSEKIDAVRRLIVHYPHSDVNRTVREALNSPEAILLLIDATSIGANLERLGNVARRVSGFANLPKVGAVGVINHDSHDRIIHAGAIIDENNGLTHCGQGAYVGSVGYHGLLRDIRNVDVIPSGIILLNVSKVINAAKSLDMNLLSVLTLGHYELSLFLRAAGYRNVVVPVPFLVTPGVQPTNVASRGGSQIWFESMLDAMKWATIKHRTGDRHAQHY